MKYLFLVFLVVPILSFSQSRAMKEISDKHDGFTMVFYYSTLKMWLSEDEAELKKIIYDIEKIKVLRLDEDDQIEPDEMTLIKKKLSDQDYEELMVIKGPTRNLMIYIREGKGIFILGSEGSEIMIIDIIGTIPINKLLTLQDKIETLTQDGSILDSFRNN